MDLLIDRCPSLLTPHHLTYSNQALKSLFNGEKISHILSFDSPTSGSTAGHRALQNAGRLSLSGAQSKFGLLVDRGQLRYSKSDEQSTYILKPRPTGYHLINHDYCAANEHVTMQIASQVYGIETAVNGLSFFSDGQPAYLTKRFDVRQDGGKFAQEDFASLMGLSRANGGSDFKYANGSYEECAEIIRRYVKSAAVDILKFFRIILFNFITLNDDAHLKNFSLVSNGTEYHLAPAYDLVNTSMQLYEPRIFALEKGLFKEGMFLSDTRQVSHNDFVEFGRRIGLPDKLIFREITTFSTPNKAVEELIARSFLSEELKELYIASHHYRQSMMRR